MANYTAKDIANWFLSKEEMSPKKVQKLVYYAYSWFLTLNNNVKTELENYLFEERIEAWVHGPVVPELYDRFKKYGYSSIPKEEIQEVKDFDGEVLDVLNQVYQTYGEFNANQLESITHQEKPWLEARKAYSPLENCNEKISDSIIFEYYGKRVSQR